MRYKRERKGRKGKERKAFLKVERVWRTGSKRNQN
jgi:hypothetical protein